MLQEWKSGLAGLALAMMGASAMAADAPTAKAYVVNEINVTDPVKYKAYADMAGPTVTAYGGHYIVRAGAIDVIDGAPPAARVVIAEFPSRAAALAWHASPEYQKALAIRNAASTSRVYVVEGAAP